MILIAYDGSEDAKAAIQHAGKLMPGSRATVLTIWEPFDTMLARTPEVLRPLARVREAKDIDREEVAAAEASMNEGVELADAAGLDATPLTARLNGSAADRNNVPFLILFCRMCVRCNSGWASTTRINWINT